MKKRTVSQVEYALQLLIHEIHMMTHAKSRFFLSTAVIGMAQGWEGGGGKAPPTPPPPPPPASYASGYEIQLAPTVQHNLISLLYKFT